MFGSFLEPQYVPCPECGASVPAFQIDEHECSPERRLDFKLFQLRAEIASFDIQLAAWLASPHGRFETWYAARTRPALAAS